MRLVRSGNDFNTSVEKALTEIDPKWREYPGLIICGTHSPEMVEEKVSALKMARENGVPTLGICFGFQLMAIEWARNVRGMIGANSTEIDPDTKHPVVVKMPELRVGMFDADGRKESFWHNYKVADPAFLYPEWNVSTQDGLVVSMNLKGLPFFWGTAYHPEYGSSKDKPHPILKHFIEVCASTIGK